MLSTNVIKNVGHASHYFSSEDNYYSRDEGFEQSEWWGRGAEKLQLSGRVDEKQFTELLQGKLPSGQQLGKMLEGEIKHRPGWDLTFSAPKSVSLLALMGGDRALIEAHREAVSVTLSYIERCCAQARIKEADDSVYQDTNNIVASLYHHDLSRAKDPQLHTHCVIMNMTERQDGKWRSLASQRGAYGETITSDVNGFIERVRQHNRYFSKIYETELAYRIKQLGYEITTDTKSGIFEIEGVSNDALKFFSKRRQQIEAELDAQGYSGGKAVAVATLKTRQAKELVDRNTLKAEWLQEAERLGLDCSQLIEKSKNPSKDITLPTLEQPAVHGVQLAIKTLSIFQTTFTLEELATEASTFAICHSISFQSVVNAIEQELKQGALISFENTRGKTVFMSQETLEDEKRLISQLKNNQLTQPSLKEPSLIHCKIDPLYQESLQKIFNNDRVLLLEGDVTKNALIEPIIKTAQAENLNIVLLSPTLIGSQTFAEKAKPHPNTFWEHLKSIFVDTTPDHYSVMEFLSNSKKADMVIVDHAHLLSTHQKVNLMEWSQKEQTKLILLGQSNTLLPQQVGNSIEELQALNVPTINIADKENLINRNIVNILDHCVGVQHEDDRFHAMANHYVNLKDRDRKHSWIVAQNKSSVEVLNYLAHQKLVEKGTVRNLMNIEVLIPVFMSLGKAENAATYQKDQIVRFNETYSSLSIERGEYLRVLDHNKISNRVILQKESGQQIVWQPDKAAGPSGKVELFQVKQREIGAGESVLFKRSIQAKNIVKGEQLTISGMGNGLVQFKKANGQSCTLDLTKSYHRHFDYGYATTLHPIAHEKLHTLIVDMSARTLRTDQRFLNQVLTQSKETWIYTDHQQKLIETLEKRTGDRLSAHETWSKAEEMKKNLHSLYQVLEKELDKRGIDKTAMFQKSTDAIAYAIHHLSEREAGFTHKQLLQTAMEHALGKVNAKSLEKAACAMEDMGILFRGNRSYGTLWTTQDTVKIEREIIMLCEQDKGKLSTILDDAFITNSGTLRPEQIKAVKKILQSRDRILAVQGYPGTGKTTMLATVANMLKTKQQMTSHKYEILGLAPTHTAVRELKERSIPAVTLDQFITQHHDSADKDGFKKDNLILIIDEASMISNHKMLDILKITHALNCRAIVTGDRRQLGAIEQGKPQTLVQAHVKTIHLKKIKRQEDAVLKQAVKETLAYEFKTVFHTIKESIIEVPVPKDAHKAENFEQIRAENRKNRIKMMVVDYFNYPKDKRDNIQVITPGHDDRQIANTLIREQLKNEGTLLKDRDQSFQILVSKTLTRIEKSEIKNYSLGKVIRFNQYESRDIKAGDYLTIVEINKENRLLKLQGKEGKDIAWQIPIFNKTQQNRIEIFEKEARNLQPGDMIRWSRSDKKEELFSSDEARVISVENNKITVELANKKELIFDANKSKYQHWDHGYAATVYAVQGKTKDIILAHLESFREYLTHQPAFLVALTRAVNVFRLYTDDAEKLLKTIIRNTGVKYSGLEVIHQNDIKNIDKELENSSSKIINHALKKVDPSFEKLLYSQNVNLEISDKSIREFAKGMTNDTHRIEKNNIEAYKSEHQRSTQETAKSISHIKEREYEI